MNNRMNRSAPGYLPGRPAAGTGPLMFFSLLCAALLCASTATAAAAPQWLLGKWQLNNEMTQALQETKKSSGSGGFGGLSSSVSVGGVAIPLPGGGAGPAGPGGSPKDPPVLRCTELKVAAVDGNLLFTFIGVDEELMQPGDNQGRVTKWGRSKLTSNYQTTSRKVYRTYKLQKDGTLLVTVKIRPKQAASIVQKRVFERPPA